MPSDLKNKFTFLFFGLFLIPLSLMGSENLGRLFTCDGLIGFSPTDFPDIQSSLELPSVSSPPPPTADRPHFDFVGTINGPHLEPIIPLDLEELIPLHKVRPLLPLDFFDLSASFLTKKTNSGQTGIYDQNILIFSQKFDALIELFLSFNNKIYNHQLYGRINRTIRLNFLDEVYVLLADVDKFISISKTLDQKVLTLQWYFWILEMQKTFKTNPKISTVFEYFEDPNFESEPSFYWPLLKLFGLNKYPNKEFTKHPFSLLWPSLLSTARREIDEIYNNPLENPFLFHLGGRKQGPPSSPPTTFERTNTLYTQNLLPGGYVLLEYKPNTFISASLEPASNTGRVFLPQDGEKIFMAGGFILRLSIHLYGETSKNELVVPIVVPFKLPELPSLRILEGGFIIKGLSITTNNYLLLTISLQNALYTDLSGKESVLNQNFTYIIDPYSNFAYPIKPLH